MKNRLLRIRALLMAPDGGAGHGGVPGGEGEEPAGCERSAGADFPGGSSCPAGLGIDAKTIPYVLKLADLSGAAGQDGKINEEAVKNALNKVLEDVHTGDGQLDSGRLSVSKPVLRRPVPSGKEDRGLLRRGNLDRMQRIA